MATATFFAWPFVHNWFVSMGMLDFALGVPLSLYALLLLSRQQRAWSWPRAAGIAGVAVATWYAHVFALMVAHLLVGVHVLAERAEPRRSPASPDGCGSGRESSSSSSRCSRGPCWFSLRSMTT